MEPRTWQRVIGLAWPLAQQSAAAVVAWLIAGRLAGHDDPFFAPVAAVIGLNATLGQRGSNALRLLAGVLIGVLVAEVAVWLAGSSMWTLAAATFLAMLLARVLDEARIVQAQAAVSAILVIVVSNTEQGWERLVDAAIGGAVALVFSQLLFTPEPLRLLRQAEATVLSTLARGLRTTCDALGRGDAQLAVAATARLRDLRDDLAALRTSSKASERITRHSVTWRKRAGVVLTEGERADHLDLLAGSCLMLTRTASAVENPLRVGLVTLITEVAAALDELAADPGDQHIRQTAAEHAAELAAWLVTHGGKVAAPSALAAAYASVRMVAVDVMVFTGVDPEQAFRAVNSSGRDE